MSTQISNQVFELQKQIFKEQYYVSRWLAALAFHEMSTATIDQHEHSDQELVLLCHDFWDALPDSKEIRREPFFLLCDIAEHVLD